jgi:tellurite resistance protein
MKYNSKSQKLSRLKNFPISILSLGLGLIGFALAWQKAEQIFNIPVVLSYYLLNLSLFLTVVILIIYCIKWIKYPQLVKSEFNHPIKINFYPIISKILFIASIFYLSLDIEISKYLWWLGVVLQLIFTFIIMSMWIRQNKFEIHHINPSWFIPVVGNMIAPIAGVRHFSSELSWFLFSIGIFWWLILTVIVIYRMIFFRPIIDKLVPTMFILFAPPIIGFIALTKLMGISLVGNMLYYIGFFLFLLIMFQFTLFSRLKFTLSWWAYSFPLDALVVGTFLMYHETGIFFYQAVGLIIFGGLNCVILLLLVKTFNAIKNRQICIEEKE